MVDDLPANRALPGTLSLVDTVRYYSVVIAERRLFVGEEPVNTRCLPREIAT
jgi:hypothetical protein